MDTLLRRTEHIESGFAQFEKIWEERWDRLESIVAWPKIDSTTSTASSASASVHSDDSVIVSKIETLNADVFTVMDELFEKIMRLEERIGIRFRLFCQDLFREPLVFWDYSMVLCRLLKILRNLLRDLRFSKIIEGIQNTSFSEKVLRDFKSMKRVFQLPQEKKMFQELLILSIFLWGFWDSINDFIDF